MKLFYMFVFTIIQMAVYGQYEFEVRFRSPPVQNSGIVEVYYNDQWWLIASTRWTQANTFALCRSLGYADAKTFSFTSSAKGSYEPTTRLFKCNGSEAGLQYCEQKKLAEVPDLSSSVVQITCTGLEERHVRLVGGLTIKEGRAEVYHNNEWGTICNNGMVLSDAETLCRTAGFESTNAFYELSSSHLPEATGRIWIHNLRCHGDEYEIGHCQKISWGDQGCTHADDIYIHCYSENDLRLKENVIYGEVEIFHSGLWGSICEHVYDVRDQQDREVKLVCQDLGFSSAVTGQYVEISNDQSGWASHPYCSGRDRNFTDCIYSFRREQCRSVWYVVCMQSIVPVSNEQRKYACYKKCDEEYCYKTGPPFSCECRIRSYGSECEKIGPSEKAAIVGTVGMSIIIIALIITFMYVRKKRKSTSSHPIETETENRQETSATNFSDVETEHSGRLLA